MSQPRTITEEEFENREWQGVDLAGAAMLGLQRILEPQAKRGIEVVQDFKGGKYDKKQNSGDGENETELNEENE